MSLLDSAAMWFARADTFTDRYELGVPAADLSAARAGAEQVLADATGLPRAGLAGLPDSEVAGLLLSHAGQALYISCYLDYQAGSWGPFHWFAPDFWCRVPYRG